MKIFSFLPSPPPPLRILEGEGGGLCRGFDNNTVVPSSLRTLSRDSLYQDSS